MITIDVPTISDETRIRSVLDPTRLTPAAGRVLALAHAEAAAFGHTHVTTEHLLIALAAEERGAAARVLGVLDLTAEVAREQVAFLLGPGEEATDPTIERPWSPRLEQVLEAAGHEAARRDHAKVGTLHLLLALVKERKGVAVMLLEAPGMGLEVIGRAMARAFREQLTDQE